MAKEPVLVGKDPQPVASEPQPGRSVTPSLRLGSSRGEGSYKERS